ncbi:MAG TPA: BON domain-containing protein [Gemmataceae bacterium]|jgi:osmotically-inducible protein OsmY
MRWTLAQARLALFTASALGLARPGVAQQSPYLPIGTPTPASKMRPDAHPYATVNQHQAMTDAIKIELAWLADPATFPCRLGTYQDGENLKVRGFVPNQAVKMRAMEIAGHQTAMSLIDELRINSNMPMPVAGIPVDKILGDAAQALVKQLGDKANPLELTASVSGQIVVSGTLPTPADQLTVSHCLWAVHGCTSVRNLVTVPGFSTGSSVTSKSSIEKKPEAVTAPKVVSLPDPKANAPKMVALPEPKANTPKMAMTPDAKAAAPKMETI